MAKLTSVETKIVKDVEEEMMRTLRRPRGMAKLRSVETKIVKDVDSSFLQQTEAVKKSPKVLRCDQCTNPSRGAILLVTNSYTKSQRRKRKLASIGVSKVVIIIPETTTISTVIWSPAEDLHKAARPKTRPLITSNHVCNIANRVAIRDVIGEDMFEKGIDQALRQELQGFEKNTPCIWKSPTS